MLTSPKKIAIFGAGAIGRRVNALIKFNNMELKALYYCDNNTKLHGKIIDSLPVISAHSLSEIYQQNEIDFVLIAVSNSYLKEISEQLVEYKINNVFITPHYYLSKNTCGISKSNIMLKIEANKPRLKYFEFHICDHCNMNCTGCGHFSNISKEYYADVDAYAKDLFRLKELFWGVERIRLMGGEPLIHDKLNEFIDITGEVFPDSLICIATNGILLNKMPPNLFDAVRGKNARFDISLYPPMYNKKDDLEILLDIYEVSYKISISNRFIATHSLDPINNNTSSYENCKSSQCHFLRNGHLSNCGIPQLIKTYYDYFGLGSDTISICSENKYNIYEESNGWELNEKLSKPIPMCSHCNIPGRDFAWNNTSKEMSDWIA